MAAFSARVGNALELLVIACAILSNCRWSWRFLPSRAQAEKLNSFYFCSQAFSLDLEIRSAVTEI